MSHASVIVALDGSVEPQNIEDAVAYQMAPFDENDEWFADGSRWDWYQIGGRFSGRHFFGENVIRRGELTEKALRAQAVAAANKLWDDYLAEDNPDDFTRGYIYGLAEDETRSDTIANSTRRILWSWAFLKDRKWFEQARMGWFATATAPECHADDDTWSERCVTKCEKTGGQIATFVGPKDSDDVWAEMYWARFIRPLPDNTWLVTVDFHV